MHYRISYLAGILPHQLRPSEAALSMELNNSFIFSFVSMNSLWKYFAGFPNASSVHTECGQYVAKNPQIYSKTSEERCKRWF